MLFQTSSWTICRRSTGITDKLRDTREILVPQINPVHNEIARNTLSFFYLSFTTKPNTRCIQHPDFKSITTNSPRLRRTGNKTHKKPHLNKNYTTVYDVVIVYNFINNCMVLKSSAVYRSLRFLMRSFWYFS